MRCIGSVYKILQIVLAKETSILHGISFAEKLVFSTYQIKSGIFAKNF